MLLPSVHLLAHHISLSFTFASVSSQSSDLFGPLYPPRFVTSATYVSKQMMQHPMHFSFRWLLRIKMEERWCTPCKLPYLLNNILSHVRWKNLTMFKNIYHAYYKMKKTKSPRCRTVEKIGYTFRQLFWHLLVPPSINAITVMLPFSLLILVSSIRTFPFFPTSMWATSTIYRNLCTHIDFIHTTLVITPQTWSM